VDRQLLDPGGMERPHRPPGATPTPIPDALNLLTARIIGCAIEVHRRLGPGLLESAYECALCIELSRAGLQFLQQVSCPVEYDGHAVGAYRLDLLVENAVVVEVKSVATFERVSLAQVLTYLRATGCRLGLIINFNVPLLTEGIRRVAL
jgi:GxxExxY protein